MPRLTFTHSIDVEGSPDQVFGYLAEPRRHIEWAGLENKIGLTELQVDGAGPIALGARFHSIGREEDMVMRDESTVTVFRPPTAFGFDTVTRILFARMGFTHRYDVRGTPAGTRVTYTASAEPLNLGAWVLFLLMLTLSKSSKRPQRHLMQGLDRFRRAYEAQRVGRQIVA